MITKWINLRPYLEANLTTTYRHLRFGGFEDIKFDSSERPLGYECGYTNISR